MTNTLSYNEAPVLDDAADAARQRQRRWLPVSFSHASGGESAGLATDHRRVLAAAVAILEQGEDLLGALSASQYTARVPAVFNACVGGHYRHCLDHFASLLRGVGRDFVDYDHRDRDVRIESEPHYALHVTRDLRTRLNILSESALAAPVTTRCEVSYEHGDSPSTRSSFARELAYCIAHAIHHYALISVMARLMEVKLPKHFGVAPSTVAHAARANQSAH
ncbi:MAG TPA: hypothetical protein VI454_08785 [Verrucomicrobiae bacterium]|jgi:hypothetical protein